MKDSIYQELRADLIDVLKQRPIHFTTEDDAKQWFSKHEVNIFEAISEIVGYEIERFGEVQLKTEDINAGSVLFAYSFIKTEEFLNKFKLDQDNRSLLKELKSKKPQLKEGTGQ